MLIAIAAALLLPGCEDRPSSVADMLAQNEPQVCTQAEVQKAVVRTIASQLYPEFERSGGKIEFVDVNATGVNKEISEVSCAANLMTERSRLPVKWSIRPALGDGGTFIVEIAKVDRNTVAQLSGEMHRQMTVVPSDGAKLRTEPKTVLDAAPLAENEARVDRTAEIETSFGPYVNAAVCEGEWWQKGERNGRSTLAWMEDNNTPDLASDDYYVEYDTFYDGEMLYLTNGIISAYRLENPLDGKTVPNKRFSMKRRGNGWVLNGEALDLCRN